MRHRLTIAILGLALVFFASPGPFLAQKMPPQPPQFGRNVGNLAHDFTLKGLDGKDYHLKGLRGDRIVHVVFWATWCVPCVEEIPRLREAYDKFHDRGFEVLGVALSMNETEDQVRAFAAQHKLNYPVLWDEGMTLMNRYRIDSIPQNFLIDREGIIRYAGNSLPQRYEETLERALAQPSGSGPAAR
jgi:peroxiredoxin